MLTLRVCNFCNLAALTLARTARSSLLLLNFPIIPEVCLPLSCIQPILWHKIQRKYIQTWNTRIICSVSRFNMEQLKASFLIFLHLPVSRFDVSFKCNMDYMQTTCPNFNQIRKLCLFPCFYKFSIKLQVNSWTIHWHLNDVWFVSIFDGWSSKCLTVDLYVLHDVKILSPSTSFQLFDSPHSSSAKQHPFDTSPFSDLDFHQNQ